MLGALALGGMMLAAPVLAADATPETPQFSWTGVYLGVSGGYGWGETRMTDNGATPTAPWSNAFPIGGALVGLTAGANAQLSALVLGVEGDLSGAAIQGTHAGFLGTVGMTPPAGWNCSFAGPTSGPCYINISTLATLRGRVGIAAGQALIYGTGGLAYAQVDAGIVNGPGHVGSWWQKGWTAGGGVEYAFDQGWSAKVEYLYVDLGWTPPVGDAFQAYAAANIVRFGINRQFR
jgi:outer membrane immunogenic protein